MIARQTKNVMMATMNQPQSRVECRHVFEDTLPGGEAFDATLQCSQILAGLGVTPLLSGVANDVPQIRFSR